MIMGKKKYYIFTNLHNIFGLVYNLDWLKIIFSFLAARDMHVFMMNWYEKFPEFKSRELFLTGESYAGMTNSNWSFSSSKI